MVAELPPHRGTAPRQFLRFSMQSKTAQTCSKIMQNQQAKHSKTNRFQRFPMLHVTHGESLNDSFALLTTMVLTSHSYSLPAGHTMHGAQWKHGLSVAGFGCCEPRPVPVLRLYAILVKQKTIENTHFPAFLV